MNKLESYLVKITKELFCFSSVVLPDDLQAQQVVSDAVCVLTLKRKDLLEKLWMDLSRDEENHYHGEVKIFLMSEIFRIGQKRQLQLGQSVVYDGDDTFSAFYTLDSIERAVLFLKHKTSYEIENIAEIVHKQSTEVISILQSARKKLMNGIGRNFDLQF